MVALPAGPLYCPALSNMKVVCCREGWLEGWMKEGLGVLGLEVETYVGQREGR